MVTAISILEYQVIPLVEADTMAECYHRSVVYDLEEKIEHKLNTELLCIRVDE